MKIMNGKVVHAALAVSALALGLTFTSHVNAASVSCNVGDATAQGANEDERVADLCYADDSVGANPSSETEFVNSFLPVFGSDDDFTYIGKHDGGAFEDSNPSQGFTLTVSGDSAWTGDGFKYNYTLQATGDWAGETIDWVLGVKQASGPSGGSFTAYYWEALTLDISGQFNSFFINPGGNESNDYSHASGFVRLSSNGNGDDLTPPAQQIPEPATLGLLGIGLLGLGVASYRRRRNPPIVGSA